MQKKLESKLQKHGFSLKNSGSNVAFIIHLGRYIMEEDTASRQLVGYSFLVVFANDKTINEEELKMLERIALGDGRIDDDERGVLKKIFSKVTKETVTERVWEEITKFRNAFSI